MNRKPNQKITKKKNRHTNSENDETLLTFVAIYFDGHFY